MQAGSSVQNKVSSIGSLTIRKCMTVYPHNGDKGTHHG